MLVGWRMQEDLEALADLPNGTLMIDVLNGTASHSTATVLSLHIAEELQAWLKHRTTELRIPFDTLNSATIIADISTDRIATNRKRIVAFDFKCRSKLVSGEHTYEGVLNEKHVWHSRVTA